VVNFLIALTELFRQHSQLRRYEQILVEIVLFERGVGGQFERKFPGEGCRPPTNFGVRKLGVRGVRGLSRGVVCVILYLAVLIQYRRVTQTDTR